VIRVKCSICAKCFEVKASHQKRGWGKYCSTNCRSKSQLRGQSVTCHTCHQQIYRSPRMLTRSKSGFYFCSKSCQTLWRNKTFIGEKSANWKNGEQAYRKILLRGGVEPVCAICKNSDPRILSAHHIDHDRSNNHIRNLIWLCFNCHYLSHHDSSFNQKVLNMVV